MNKSWNNPNPEICCKSTVWTMADQKPLLPSLPVSAIKLTMIRTFGWDQMTTLVVMLKNFLVPYKGESQKTGMGFFIRRKECCEIHN